MGNTRANPGGIRLFNEGEKLQYGDLINQSDILLRVTLHLLQEMFYDEAADTPQEGVFGNSFECTGGTSGTMEVDVARGLAWKYNSSASDDFDPHLDVCALAATETKTLSAGDASNPRIDLISVIADTDDDVSVSDQIKNPATGSVSTSSIYTRRVWASTVTVTEGTPAASPSTPPTPTGHLALATVLVPTGETDIDNCTITDARDRLTFAEQVQPQAHIYLDLTANAESGNAIAVDVQIKYMQSDDNYTSPSGTELLCEVFNGDFEIDSATLTLTETGAGTANWGSGKARMKVTTDTNGACQITITDGSGSYADFAYLKITPLSVPRMHVALPEIERVMFT